jgi:hypothetical protein
MPTQKSNCCKALIELTGNQDHKKAFKCAKCGRIIGTPTYSLTNIFKKIKAFLRNS